MLFVSVIRLFRKVQTEAEKRITNSTARNVYTWTVAQIGFWNLKRKLNIGNKLRDFSDGTFHNIAKKFPVIFRAPKKKDVFHNNVKTRSWWTDQTTHYCLSINIFGTNSLTNFQFFFNNLSKNVLPGWHFEHLIDFKTSQFS